MLMDLGGPFLTKSGQNFSLMDKQNLSLPEKARPMEEHMEPPPEGTTGGIRVRGPGLRVGSKMEMRKEKGKITCV